MKCITPEGPYTIGLANSELIQLELACSCFVHSSVTAKFHALNLQSWVKNPMHDCHFFPDRYDMWQQVFLPEDPLIAFDYEPLPQQDPAAAHS